MPDGRTTVASMFGASVCVSLAVADDPLERMPVMAESFLVAAADRDESGNHDVRGQAERVLHLRRIEAEHRRRRIAERRRGEEKIAEGDVALAGAPLFAFGIGLRRP